jgi:hypothetical protein
MMNASHPLLKAWLQSSSCRVRCLGELSWVEGFQLSDNPAACEGRFGENERGKIIRGGPKCGRGRVNPSKCLTSLGYRVYYLVNNSHDEDRTARHSFLDTLRNSNALTDQFEFNAGSAPKWRAKPARSLVHPGARNWLMSPEWTPYKTEVLSLLERYPIDLCVLATATLFLCSRNGRAVRRRWSTGAILSCSLDCATYTGSPKKSSSRSHPRTCQEPHYCE